MTKVTLSVIECRGIPVFLAAVAAWSLLGTLPVRAQEEFWVSSTGPSAMPSPTLYTPSELAHIGAPGGRSSLASWMMYRADRLKVPVDGLLRLGPVNVGLSTGATVGYNSNVNSSSSAPVGDFFLMPSVGVGFDWVVTPKNRLTLNLGLSYTFYLENPNYNTNSFVLDPGTLLKYDFYTGDFVISLYDTPAITSVPDRASGVSNVVNFNQLHNALGLSVLWDLNKITLNAGVEFDTTLSLSNQFQSQNFSQFTMFGGAYYQVTPTLKMGIKGLVAPSEYGDNVLNNFIEYELGLVIQAKLSRYTTAFAEMGGQLYVFSDNGKQGANGPVLQESGGNTTNVLATGGGGNHASPVVRMGISNQLNAYYAQALSLSYETQNAGISNYTQTGALEYSGNWTINRKVTLNSGISFQQNTFSGEGTGSSLYCQAQLGFIFSFSRNLPLSVTYTYINQIGHEHLQGYAQSTFSVGFVYRF